jgi:hypothetical protein
MAIIADIRHYFGEVLNSAYSKGYGENLREFLGSIVEAVTSRDPDEVNCVTELQCYLGLGGCDGQIIAYFEPTDPSIIKWSCILCEECGSITGWENSIWDKRFEIEVSAFEMNESLIKI